MDQWDDDIKNFISLCQKHGVRLLMVGGGAVNFHGYQRHSADVDFWIETSEKNLLNLKAVLHSLGFEFTDFPDEVKNQQQNISIKFSPVSLNIELITKFDVGKSFEEAYRHAEIMETSDYSVTRWHILNLEDLIISKIKSGRPKDLLDIQELKRRNSSLKK